MTPPPRTPGRWVILDSLNQQVGPSYDSYLPAWHAIVDYICADWDIQGFSINWRPNPADTTQKAAYEAGRFDSKWRFK